MHPHWAPVYSLLNGTMLCLASSSTILTHKIQVKRRKGSIQVLTAKTREPKMVNHTRAFQMALLPVQTTRCPNFLANVLFSRNQAIKLKSKRRSTSPLDLASGNLGGTVIAAAVASCMQQLNCNSMLNIACNIAYTITVT